MRLSFFLWLSKLPAKPTDLIFEAVYFFFVATATTAAVDLYCAIHGAVLSAVAAAVVGYIDINIDIFTRIEIRKKGYDFRNIHFLKDVLEEE